MGELLKEAADADDLIAYAQVCRQAAAVFNGAGRGVGAGHTDADDVFRAQGLSGDSRHQRGVDAPAETYQDFLKSAFAYVIPRAQNKSAIGGLGIVLLGSGQWLRSEWVNENQILFKGCSLGNQLSASIQSQRGAIEDQAVVAAHLVA